jgi:hypothetical protein
MLFFFKKKKNLKKYRCPYPKCRANENFFKMDKDEKLQHLRYAHFIKKPSNYKN